VAAGETHTVVLTWEHKVLGWGLSMYGQLGLGFGEENFEPGTGQINSKVTVPTEISPFLPPKVEIVSLYCGATYTLMLSKNGELYGCGLNDLGQLGLDTFVEEIQLQLLDRSLAANRHLSTNVKLPSKVICFEKMNIQTVVCGENHSLAVIGEDRNMLWSWGNYKQG
jgi:alpha-tubulin suppressor-like RCC1 family protein